MALSPALRASLEDIIAKHPIVLFMKGTREAPACGFSASVAGILDEHGASYETVNVLTSPELREGIKELSQWPTIPQLYVKGQFVGGADIVRQMAVTGELSGLLGGSTAELKPPSIRLTEAAKRAFASALADASGEVLHLEVSPRYEYELYFGPAEARDIVSHVEDLAIHLSPPSARRADGLSIDFVDGPGGGFKLESPNEPAKIEQLTVTQLKAWMDEGKDFDLYDVRPKRERAVASIQGAKALDELSTADLDALDKNRTLVLHCHHGIRSQTAAEQLRLRGFRRLFNLAGGIAAWSAKIDPNVPSY